MSFIGKAVGALTGMLGITGDVPQGSQTQTGYFPKNVNIDLPLYSAKQTASGNTISNTAKFSPEGLRIEDLLKGVSSDKREELLQYITGGGDEMIAREQQLFQEAADPGISTARNRLRDQVTSGTGGLFTTPGGQQAIGGFEAQVSADKAGRNLQAIDRSEGRRKLLESEQTATLNNLVAYQNMPQAAAAMALSTGTAAAAGNQASAAMLYQNEQNNRAATGNFLNAIIGGFAATQGGGGGGAGGAGFGANTGFGSQGFNANAAFGNVNQYAGMGGPFSISTPSYSGGSGFGQGSGYTDWR